MIPELIAKKNIDTALSYILREGVPSRQRGRDYCLVADGKHFPPKYTIALAHRIATGEFLSSDRFSGGKESNDFLVRRGFNVVECGCGGVCHDRRPGPETVPSASPGDDRLAKLAARFRHATPTIQLGRETRDAQTPELDQSPGVGHPAFLPRPKIKPLRNLSAAELLR